MKLGLLLIAVVITAGCQSVVSIADKVSLEENVGRNVILTGRYHDPGKGDRGLDCGFARLAITDDSLFTKDKAGYLQLVPEVEEGAWIEVRAYLRFFPSTRVPVDEQLQAQRVAGRRETINGRTYEIYDDAYVISKVRLIRRVTGVTDKTR